MSHKTLIAAATLAAVAVALGGCAKHTQTAPAAAAAHRATAADAPSPYDGVLDLKQLPLFAAIPGKVVARTACAMDGPTGATITVATAASEWGARVVYREPSCWSPAVGARVRVVVPVVNVLAVEPRWPASASTTH